MSPRPVLHSNYGLSIAAVVVAGVGFGFIGFTLAVEVGSRVYKAVFGS